MKKIFKSIFILSIAGLFASCNVDNIGTLYELENGQSGVSFTKTMAGDTEVDAKASTFTVPIARAVADGSLTVNLASTLPEGVKVPSSVTFNAGEYETEVTLDISNMEVGKTYKGAVSLADKTQFDENTAISSINVTLAKAYTWVSLGKGQLYDGLALQPSADDLGIIQVEVLQADGFNRWRIMNPFPVAQLEKAWAPAYVTYTPTQMIEFFSDADGAISFTSLPIKTGLTYVDLGDNAYIYYYLPSKYSSNYGAEEDAENCFVMDKVAQFCFGANIENTTYGFGLNYLYLSLPGGPDLNDLLQ
jgi:hypothetical protein